GRRDWAGVLVARGFGGERIELYRRVPITPAAHDGDPLTAWAWQGEATTCVGTTVDAADRLLAEIARRGIGAWARGCPAFCPHRRIASRLTVAGWRDARVPGAGRRLLDAAIESKLAPREAGNDE